jgi:uncharacterized membrane protein
MLLALVAVTVGGVAYFLLGRGGTAITARFSGGDVRIPVAQVGSEARFFEYRTDSGTPVRFFVLRSSDGKYRAAADACGVCYRRKLGYEQQGDDMVCRSCGRHFPSGDVSVATDGCRPGRIPVTRQGDNLVIAAADLSAHARLF